MKNETKMQVIDFFNYLENSGKISTREHKQLRGSLEESKEKKEIPITLLTRDEVAKFLKVSPRTVDRMREKGLLKFHKLGPRYIRFNMEDVLSAVG